MDRYSKLLPRQMQKALLLSNHRGLQVLLFTSLRFLSNKEKGGEGDCLTHILLDQGCFLNTMALCARS